LTSFNSVSAAILKSRALFDLIVVLAKSASSGRFAALWRKEFAC
jgi:hypothetical protein